MDLSLRDRGKEREGGGGVTLRCYEEEPQGPLLSWLEFAGLRCLWSCVNGSPRNTGPSGLQAGFGLS